MDIDTLSFFVRIAKRSGIITLSSLGEGVYLGTLQDEPFFKLICFKRKGDILTTYQDILSES